ncbi:ABC transporter permease, partial [bacterium]|nr:ABC transporter permease [bacterium]
MTLVINFFGKRLHRFFYHLGCFGDLLWQTVKALADFGTYSTLLAGQMMRIGVQSLPVVIYIAMFAGMVTAIQSSENFTEFVPPYLIGMVVEKGVLRELS